MIRLQDFQACLFDVDKTLTNSNKELTAATVQAVKKLAGSGIMVGVCTGRNYATISGMLQACFPRESLHVVCGGAQVVSTQGEVMYENNLEANLVKAIYDSAQANNCRFIAETSNRLYANAKAYGYKARYVLTGQADDVVAPIANLRNWNVPLVSVADIGEQFRQTVLSLPVAAKFMTGYHAPYVDITALGVNKASGVREWCKATGIAANKVVGFGDSENDVEFLQTVGLSVAMGNASDKVKSIAQVVIGDCDHDGIAKWVEENL